MEELGNDIVKTIQGYYDDLVLVLPKMGVAIIVFVLAITIASWLKRTSKRTLTGRVEDPLLVNFLSQVINVTVVIIGFIMVLNIIGLGTAAASLLAGAGIGAFVIGFAFKDIGENFLAGIMMAFKRPFSIGDVIETGDVTGKVIGMTLRDTQVKTFAGKDVFIPNGMIMKQPIINRTIDGFLRYDFSIGLDYADDLREGVAIVERTLRNTPGVLDDPSHQVSVNIEELGTSTVNIGAYLWINTDDPNYSGTKVKAEAMEKSVLALSAAGYYLPADIIEIKNYQDNSLATEAREKLLEQQKDEVA